jgi:hypothetical protein
VDSVADAAKSLAPRWGFTLTRQANWKKNALSKFGNTGTGAATRDQAFCRIDA